MYFDLAAFLRYNFRAFFKTKGEHYRLTPKRFLVLFIWLILYIPAQIINRFFFLVDEVIYPRYRQQEVKKPVFIIGNPRSGTTFLHRLMDKDKDNFTSFAVWELLFAPSITQRKIIIGLGKVLKLLGYPVKKVTELFNSKFAIDKAAHKIKLDEAEEDEHILIHAWSSETLWPLYPIKNEIFPYFFFDRDIPRPQQQKIMKFYKNMIQRHIYAHGGNKILLSKNPSHTAKIAALQEYFPDARFIHLARNPFESMPSMLNYMATGWKLFCDPYELYPYKQEFFEVMNFYYLYPVEYFQNKGEVCTFIKYEDLVGSPDEIADDIYAWLGLEMSDAFALTVDEETEKARKFVSKHNYTMEEMGLSEALIFQKFNEVFNYFEFETRQQELPDRVMLWQIKGWRQDWKIRRLERRGARLERKVQRRERRRSEKILPSSGTLMPKDHPSQH